MIYNKRIFITGGSGFIGRMMLERYSKYNHVTVYSRDESKQYYLKKLYPSVNFVIGDVRNYDLMKRASKNHNIGIFAASMKQIEFCSDNYEEAESSIVQGAFNSRRISEENYFESACFISSDKSRAATTLYGAMKFVAGESFITNVKKSRSGCNLSTVIYGNVLNSTGSIIPVIWDHIKEKTVANVYDMEMTRFLMTSDEAIDLIEKSLKYSGVNVLPKCRSFKIKDLFEIYGVRFGLKYDVSVARPNEKIHEILSSSEESLRTIEDGGVYIMHNEKQPNNVKFIGDQYSSKDYTLSKDELEDVLKKYNYFEPRS